MDYAEHLEALATAEEREERDDNDSEYDAVVQNFDTAPRNTWQALDTQKLDITRHHLSQLSSMGASLFRR